MWISDGDEAWAANVEKSTKIILGCSIVLRVEQLSKHHTVWRVLHNPGIAQSADSDYNYGLYLADFRTVLEFLSWASLLTVPGISGASGRTAFVLVCRLDGDVLY